MSDTIHGQRPQVRPHEDDSGARLQILARVREALGSPAAERSVVPRAYRQQGETARSALARRFSERVADYQAEVHRVTATGLGGLLLERCVAHGVRTAVVPAGLPEAWRPGAVSINEDAQFGTSELDCFDAVITGCTIAIAETGTLVLTGARDEGRRALSLVPDVHICVVREERIVGLLPEAMTALAERVRRERCPVTFISGPSATSDIELSRVEGVHGPRTLIVVILRSSEVAL